MTITDEILICANKLANAGTKPTVALVKAKLSQHAPLPTLINTLRNWQHQPDFITPISTQDEHQVSEESSSGDTVTLLNSLLENGALKKVIQQSLDLELSAMKKELSEMKLLIENLTKQLHQKK